MEDIESYFVLLHKIFKIDLKVACNKHVTHTEELKKNGRDATKFVNRKSLRMLLQPDTLEVFLSAQQNEFAIWDFAKQLHAKQLSEFGLTLESSHAYFRSICS
jgi:molybdopterin-guanine dinucleotide biosynthesis protein